MKAKLWKEAIDDLAKHFEQSDEFAWDIRMIKEMFEFSKKAEQILDHMEGNNGRV